MNQRSTDQMKDLMANLSEEDKQAAVAEAVNSASPEKKKDVAREAVEQLTPQQQKEVATGSSRLRP